MITAKFAAAPDPPWLTVETVAMSAVPKTGRTPDRYVLIEGDGAPLLRGDIYVHEPQAYPFEDVQVWNMLVVAGYAGALYCVNVATRATTRYPLDGYFGHLYVEDRYCLATSASEVLRLNPDGTLMWRRENCAVDGIIINNVDADTIAASAEWDPPGDWRPFKLRLSTGEPL
jgi:hypothetical protein